MVIGPGNMIFSEVARMVVTWWIVAFCAVHVIALMNNIQ